MEKLGFEVSYKIKSTNINEYFTRERLLNEFIFESLCQHKKNKQHKQQDRKYLINSLAL